MRNLTILVTVEFVQAASYGDSTASTREVVIKQDLMADIKDKQVLLVDTIIDTGRTLDSLFRMFSTRNPAGLAAVALLNKKTCRIVDVTFEYCGFGNPGCIRGGIRPGLLRSNTGTCRTSRNWTQQMGVEVNSTINLFGLIEHSGQTAGRVTYSS